MDIQKISITQLSPAKYNPRKDLKPGDVEYERLRRSIEEFGYVEPLVWNKRTGNIVGGHQRFKVLVAMGYDEIDCVVIDLDAMREKALNVALNKISGEFDIPMLSDLLRDLDDSGFDVSLTGFDAAEMDDLFNEKPDAASIKEDNFDADKAAAEIDTPISQRGDVWLLGGHRLMCGDSTASEDVKVLMDGARARMIFTDPPWNVDYGAAKHPNYKQRQILNDKMSTEQFGAFLLSAFQNMGEVSEPGCMTYVVMSAQEWGNVMNTLAEAGFHWSSTIIWAKDRLVLSRKDYHTQYEPIWYGWLNGKRLCPLKDRKQSDLWEVQRPQSSPEHPTMKPVALVGRAIMNSSDTGETVLDLFGGSGTTLIAAAQTDRVCSMMELDPKYCDVIVRRYIEHAGGDADVYLLRGDKKAPYVEVCAT